MLSTTGSARLSRSAFQSGPIQAGSNLMCVCVCGREGEHPRTQPVHTQSAVAQSHYSACYWPLSHGAAQHRISQPQPAELPLWGQQTGFLIFRGARLTLAPPPPPPPLSSLPGVCRLSFLSVSPSLPPRLYLLPSSTPSSVLCLPLLCIQPSSPALPLSLSPCHGHSFLSGQQRALFSSLLSAALAKLPIHLLRLPYSLPCLQNPLQLQSPHK